MHDHDIFGEPVVAVLLQVVLDDHLVPVLVHHAGVFVIVRGRKFQQQIIHVLLEDALDRVLPTLVQLQLASGLGVQVVGFIGNQNNLVLAKILERNGVLFFRRKVNVQLLNRSEADVDVVRVDALKVLDGRNAHVAVADEDVRFEKKLGQLRIQEVVLRLLDDVRRIDEEQEIPVTLLIQVENQPRHDKRLAAARRHVEKQMARAFLKGEILFEIANEPLKGIFLVRSQFKFLAEIIGNVLRNSNFGKIPSPKFCEQFVV